MTAPPSTLRALGRALTRSWRLRARDQSWMAWLGLALVASGLLHVVVLLVLGGSVHGPVSWRKPIVFGLSGGLTTLSLAWLIGQLPATRWRARLAATYTVAMAIEVALITMQAWRGVPSHFNIATTFDAAVFGAMGWMIAIVAVVASVWTVQRFRARSGDAPADRAARHGMLYLLGSIAVGVAMISLAQADARAGVAILEPEAYRGLGLLKLPHAIGLHGIQALPLLAFVLRRAGLDERARLRRVSVASLGYGLLQVAALVWPALQRSGDATLVAAAGRPLLALVTVALALTLAPFVLPRLRVGPLTRAHAVTHRSR